MLKYSGHMSNGVTILVAEEAQGLDSAASQREWLNTTVNSCEDPRFIVDLTDIPYMASSDIGALITLKSRITSRQGKMVIANVDPFILESLHAMKIDHLFTIVPDLAAAFEALSA